MSQDELNQLKARLDTIEQEYNAQLEQLQQIVDEKGDAAAGDPEYIKIYEEASKLNDEYESLQEAIISMEATIQETPAASAPPVTAPSIDLVSAPSIVQPTEVAEKTTTTPAPGQAQAPAPPASLSPESIEAPHPPIQEPVPVKTPPAAVVEEKPPEPKYITVERTRIEERVTLEQSWSFVGYSSKITQVLADLERVGGFITENILSKQPGKVTFLIPFKVQFPIGMMANQYIKRHQLDAGVIFYPSEKMNETVIKSLQQLIQQFLASRSSGNSYLVFSHLKPTNDASSDPSLILGGANENVGKVMGKLKNHFKNVFFDDSVFYSGAWLEPLKAITGNLGITLLTMIGSTDLIKDQEAFKNLVSSF